ncbi:putative lipid II flippase FtsW [Synergistaceae bacterium OttesenSCG-928-D05]|nr:putative lipid II flippase FtsW [Synergistaceae bacterium OttesenSCG-928-D05]
MARAEEISTYNRTFKINPFLWVIPLVLSGIGILMITSTTSPTSFEYTGTPFLVGIRQLKWLGIALVTMLAMSAIPLKFWYKMSGVIFLLTWAMSFLPLVPGIGAQIGGANRWIQLPGISIQPGELLCLAVALHLAKLLSRGDKRAPKAFFITLVIFFIAMIPLMLQPDFGTTILIFFVSMGMFVERYGWKWPLLVGGTLCGIGLPTFIFLEPYRMRRVTAFLDPWSDPLGKGFQAIQGLIAFANGGLWGSGLGHGFQKLNYLPAAYTDFIYAAIGEELGFVGTGGVLLLFAFWVLQTRQLYYRTSNAFMASLTWGVTLTVLFPLVINVAGVTKMIPLTGMPLPFISYGGTSLLMMWARIGMLVRLEKESYREAAWL